MVGLPCIHHKKKYLPLIKRGNISVKRGSQREDITSYNSINKKRALSFQTIQQIKNKNHCNLYEIYINWMLCYHFSRNIPFDMPIHNSLYSRSCLVVVHSLKCSIHLSKYHAHVPYILFIPPSVSHILHQVHPNHFSSQSSLTFTGMKYSVRHLFKHAFLTNFKLLTIWAPKFPLTYKKSTI